MHFQIIELAKNTWGPDNVNILILYQFSQISDRRILPMVAKILLTAIGLSIQIPKYIAISAFWRVHL